MSAIDGKKRDAYTPAVFDPFRAADAKRDRIAAAAQQFSDWVSEQEAAKCHP